MKQEVRHFELRADLGAVMLLVGTLYVNEAAFNEEELQQMQEQGREPQVQPTCIGTRHATLNPTP